MARLGTFYSERFRLETTNGGQLKGTTAQRAAQDHLVHRRQPGRRRAMSVRNDWRFDDLDGYIRQGEPDQAARADNWQVAIGLQAVDGLKPSAYLIETAKEHIEGRIDIAEAQRRIRSYYEERGGREDRKAPRKLISYRAVWRRFLASRPSRSRPCNCRPSTSGFSIRCCPGLANTAHTTSRNRKWF